MRRLLVLLLVLLPLTLAAPASAKGATSVTISGPGIEYVVLDFTRSPSDVDVGTLSEASGIHGIFGAGTFVPRPTLSVAELGPRYVLRWDAGEPMAVSHVYPFAQGGAWAEVPTGQEVWGTRLAGGWWHGGAALERAMRTLGASHHEPDLAAGGSIGAGTVGPGSRPAAAPSAASATPPGGAGAGWLVAAAVLVVLVAGGAGLLQRRRSGTLAT